MLNVVAALLWTAPPVGAESTIALKWEKNLLTLSAATIPGETLSINYLEAFCRSGSTQQDWRKTTIPHGTVLLSAEAHHLRLRSTVQPNVVVDHDISAAGDMVTFRLTAHNDGSAFADVQWAQPCMRVDRFTGRGQQDYYQRCFIFLERGLTTLDQTQRSQKALYTPGQVYVPRGIDRRDVNPRPLSDDVPANGLIGAFSKDDKKVVAMAWSATQELFQGVIVCIHSDFRIGGLRPGETKQILGKIYVVNNDIPALLRRYERDFGRSKE